MFPLLVFALLVLAGCDSGSSTALRPFHLPYKAGTIDLPGNWRFRDGGGVGDHSTWFWYDPNDAFAKLRVIASGCVGCVSKNSGPGGASLPVAWCMLTMVLCT